MKKLIFSLSPLFLIATPIINPFNTYNIKLNSYIFSDFSYVNDLFIHKKYSSYKEKSGKNFSILFLRASVGYNSNLYDIGVFKQENFLLTTNKDTAKFAYQLLNHKQLTENKKYNLFIKLKGFETQGFYLNKFFNVNQNLKFVIANDFFNVSLMQDGTVTGDGEEYANNKYNYDAHTTYYYSKNFLYKRKVKYQKGYGYNLHFGVLYKQNDFSARLLVNNLYSYIRIKDVPYSNVYLNSNNKNYNNGYVTYSPLFYGKETYKDYKGSADRKYDVLLSKNILYIEYFKWEQLSLKYIGIKKKNFLLSYEIRNKTISFNAHKNKYFVNLASNNINYKKATVLELSFGLNFHF